jgi:multidrug resistance efflux pump
MDVMNSPMLKSEIAESPWTGKRMKRLVLSVTGFAILVLFLPWTQNIQTNGKITTLLPGQRPQVLQAVIGGKIEKWMVKEGDFVKKGDTIVVLSEVKDAYLDPKLINQTEIKLKAKENSVLSYSSKIDAINQQITQLEESRVLKLTQGKAKIRQEEMKLEAEEADLQAALGNYRIAYSQYQRDSALLTKGIKSPLDVENRKQKLQEANAKRQTAEAKVKVAIAALENAKTEINSIVADYGEKLAKAESDRFSTMSMQLESESEVAGLRNSLSNYEIRFGFYNITAPQDGYVTKTISNGIGEILKEGSTVCTIMPFEFSTAVEIYVDPVDMPLVSKGNTMRFVFDGWPAVFFSGWPGMSYGTFPGKVVAIDNVPGENGKFRLLVSPDGTKPWPEQLKVGTGARAYMLLNSVPVWYELWRTINGFPANFYKVKEGSEKSAGKEKEKEQK